MYETGSGQKPYLPLAEASYPEEHIALRLHPFPPHVSKTAALLALCTPLPPLSTPAPAAWMPRAECGWLLGQSLGHSRSPCRPPARRGCPWPPSPCSVLCDHHLLLPSLSLNVLD